MSRAWIITCASLILILTAMPAIAADGTTPVPFTDPYVTPQVVSVEGSYTVTRNLLPTGPGALIVLDCTVAPAGPAFTLDLNGMVLDNSANPGDPVISIIGSPACQVVIRNGELRGGAAAIFSPAATTKIVVEDVEIQGPMAEGIFAFDPEMFVIRRNTVIGSGATGIEIAGGAPKTGTIEDNVLRRITDGIVVTGGNSVEISNNRIKDSFAGGAFGAGIFVGGNLTCLISQNTIQAVFLPAPGKGIWLDGSSGCKLYNNLIDNVTEEGVFLSLGSNDNLVKDNVVRAAFLDGVRVEGSGNHVDRNVMNMNGLSGAGYGLIFTVGPPPAAGNTYGRNTAVGNTGGPCNPGPGFTPDGLNFCDENGPPFAVNGSFGDNLMPPSGGLF